MQRAEQARIKDLNDDITNPDKKLSFADNGYLKAISGISAGAVFVINFLLKFSMRGLSNKEFHETQTKMNISVALKLTIARFVNSSLLLVIVNTDPGKWFQGGGLVYDANILLFMLAFQFPF